MDSLRRRLCLFCIALCVLCVFSGPALSFNKNKITYQQFDWNCYHSPHFDIYYYPEEEEFLEEMVSYAESAYLKLSKDLDHEINFKIPLIYYKTHAEFEQTNVLMQEIPEAVGAFSEPFQNRIVMPIDVPRDKMYQLLTHELVHIFEFSIFYEGSLGRAIRSQPPLWLMEGLASYLAQDEDNFDRMVLRDAVVNNIIPEIKQLNVFSFLTYRFGHSIFDFIEKDYGKEGVRTFLYEYRKVLLTNNIEKALKESFGLEVDEFDRRFQKYLRQKYFPYLLEKNEPGEYGKEIGFKKPYVFTFSPTISPSGELVAALANPKQELDVVIISTRDGSLVRNLTKGFTNKYEYITTEAFTGKKDLSWSPRGDLIAFFVRKENHRPLLIYDALTGRKVYTLKLDVDMEASPSFSPDGKKIIFSGNRNGIWDIFQVDLESKETTNITNDEFYDSNPSWSSDGKKILYNRRIGTYEKILLIDVSDPAKKTQLTFGESNDIQPSFSRDGSSIFFSSDRGSDGVFNVFSLDLQTGDMFRLTDLVGGAFTPLEITDPEGKKMLTYTALFKGTFRLYTMDFSTPLETIKAEDRVATALELEPFEAPLSLTLDEEKKGPYKMKWDVMAPEVTVGVANDGSILGYTDVTFTDLFGDHVIKAQFYSIRSYSNLDVTYLNLKHRFTYAFRGFDLRDFYIVSSPGGLSRFESRLSGAQAIMQWPFNRYYRVEGYVGGIYRSQVYPMMNQVTGQLFLQKFSESFPIAGFSFSGDTTRFKEFGAYHGKRFALSTLWAPAAGDSREFREYSLDFRSYGRLTSRSLIAWRLAGIVSDGDGANVYGVGGLNQIRGYDFREFFGTRIAYTNLELRFPLIDEMRFPFGSIRQIRGFVFADVGAAWFKGGVVYDPETISFRKFDFYDSKEKRLVDGHASFGVGFNFFFLGPLQLNWVFSKRTDLKSSESNFRTDFYIAYEF